jgi:HlyD family secretion protein
VGVNVYRAMSKEEVTVSTVKLSQQEIASNVMVPGTLRFQNEQYIYQDPEKGEIAEILVKEGESVKVGTPLLRYENEQFSLEKEQNALSIESSYLKINQLEKIYPSKLEKRKQKKRSKQSTISWKWSKRWLILNFVSCCCKKRQ